MNRTHSYKAIFSLFLLLTVLWCHAQQKTTIKATVDKNKILIGEPIQLTLEANIPANEAIQFFSIDSIPHFEISEKQKTDTSDTDDGGTVLRQIILLTSFDSGHWVIPSFVLAEGIATDSIPVDVVFSEGFNPDQDYHDIKDIIEVTPQKEKQKWWLWYAIGGGALLVIGLLVYLLRKKKPVVQAAPVIMDPYEVALKQLEKLQNEKTDRKQYYSALVDIFRVYILKKKGIHSLQKTTDDIVVQLKSIPVAKEPFEKLSQALRLSDFVKFAKYVPSAEDDANTFETIKNSITSIERLT
ncbi:MAG TPA: hypothetical protein VIZ28_19260 [Chitinophagaceae bacterium]